MSSSYQDCANCSNETPRAWQGGNEERGILVSKELEAETFFHSTQSGSNSKISLAYSRKKNVKIKDLKIKDEIKHLIVSSAVQMG